MGLVLNLGEFLSRSGGILCPTSCLVAVEFAGILSYSMSGNCTPKSCNARSPNVETLDCLSGMTHALVMSGAVINEQSTNTVPKNEIVLMTF